MATHPSVDANVKADTERVSEMNGRSEMPAQARYAENPLFREIPNIAPVAVIPQGLAKPAAGRRNQRRVITREDGRALETIGHAVDYLNDCFLYEGDEKECIHMGDPMMQALGILASARTDVLRSLPIVESRTSRLWNALFHRTSGRSSHLGSERQSRTSGVIPLSSSR